MAGLFLLTSCVHYGPTVGRHTFRGGEAITRPDHTVQLLPCLLVREKATGAWYPPEYDRGGPFRADGLLVEVRSPTVRSAGFAVDSMEVMRNGAQKVEFRRLEKIGSPGNAPPDSRHETWVPAAIVPLSNPAGALEPGTYRIIIVYRWGAERLETTWTCVYDEKIEEGWAFVRLRHS